MKAKLIKGRIIINMTCKEAQKNIVVLEDAGADIRDDIISANMAREYNLAKRYEIIRNQLDRLCSLLDKTLRESEQA